MTPRRIQLSRKKGWRKPAGAVVVARPTPWGNPYQAGKDGDGNRAYLVDLYRAYLARPEQAALVARIKSELRGRDLACWCSLDGPCHAEVLLEIANGGRIMKPDMLLPVVVPDLPASFIFEPCGKVQERIAHFIAIGVVRIAAGPETCDVTIDIKRPYYLPLSAARRAL